MAEPALNRRAAIAAILMAATAVGGQAMVPTRRMSLLRGPFKLVDLMPTNFRGLAHGRPCGHGHREPAD